jgi:hypothetical protein
MSERPEEKDHHRDDQTVLLGNDGGFGLPEADTYERDDGTEGVIPPDEIFMPPLRTAANGWQKYHAAQDCGEKMVVYTENTSTPQRTTKRYDWKLACRRCDHYIRWQDVLYISEEWFYDRAEAIGHRMFDNLWLSEEQVLDLGPDPMEAQLLEKIRVAFEDRDQMLKEHREAIEGMFNG